MNDLERLLQDPRAHGEVVASEDVAAWGEQALKRWRFRRLMESVLYRGGLLLGSMLLLQEIWSRSEITMAQLKGLPSAVSESLSPAADFSLLDHPYLVAAIGLSCAVLLTKPLRERLLQELG
ncbi:MAG: hypothetical protein ACPG31_00990 [Planctomycetota bacterium]